MAPRVDTHPPILATHEPLAFELLLRCGQRMDDWQREGVARALAHDPGDMVVVKRDLRTGQALATQGRWQCSEYTEIVSRQNGKGAILEAVALTNFLLLGTQVIMWTAHEFKTAVEAMRRLKHLLAVLGEQVSDNLIIIPGGPSGEIRIKVTNSHNDEGFERLDTGQRIKFVARSTGSGRGFSGDLVIIDEAYAYTLAQQSALLFILSARPNSQIIYTSSPPLDSVSGDVLFSLRERGDPTAPRPVSEATGEEVPYAFDPSLAYRDWGLAGDLDHLAEVDLADPVNWAATNPGVVERPRANGSGLTMDGIAKEWRKLSTSDPAGFARERLGVWPYRAPAGNSLAPITAVAWGDLALPVSVHEQARPRDVAFALHVNMDRTYTSIAWCGAHPEDQALLVVGLAEFRAGTRWATQRVVDLAAQHDPVGIGVDTRSEALIVALDDAGIRAPEDPERPYRGELYVPQAVEVAQAHGRLLDLIGGARLRHLNEPALNTSALGSTTRLLSGGRTWDWRSSVEIGPIAAVTLAVRVYELREPLVNDGYDLLKSVF